MDYYKIFGKDGSVIAAEAMEEPAFIMYQESNGTYLRCSRVKAQGILSADGSQIYQLKGYKAMPDEHLIAESITQTEYEILVEELDIDDDDDTEPEPSPDDEDSGSDVMTPQQMRERIIALEADRAELRKELSEKDTRLGYLEDAMLEVGGILYGDDDF
jgi:hypothetical protein